MVSNLTPGDIPGHAIERHTKLFHGFDKIDIASST
jgi:hypothetical protein